MEYLENSHELQQYFSSRLARYLIDKKRVPVFWEDILYQGNIQLPKETIIQWWNYRSKKELGLKLAMERNLRVIASPNYYTYLNFPESPWRGYLENRTFDIEMICTSNPAHFEKSNSLMMGITACLWTDYNLTMDMIDDRVFPRLLALAEQMWNRNDIDYDEFYSKSEAIMLMIESR
jgi:N-acetyl-beta-hexosaminidase